MAFIILKLITYYLKFDKNYESLLFERFKVFHESENWFLVVKKLVIFYILNWTMKIPTDFRMMFLFFSLIHFLESKISLIFTFEVQEIVDWHDIVHNLKFFSNIKFFLCFDEKKKKKVKYAPNDLTFSYIARMGKSDLQTKLQLILNFFLCVIYKTLTF